MFISTPKTWPRTMTKTARGLLPAVAVLGALSFSPGASAEEYDLDIDHHLAAGQRFAIEAEAYNNMESIQVIGDDAPVEEGTSFEINIEGELEILAVDGEGGVTQLALSVARYDIEIDDEGIEIETDQRLLATVDGDTADFTYEDGSALPDDVSAVLDELLGDLLSKEGDDDDVTEAMMFGFDQPREPGEEWELDAAGFFDEMGDEDGGMLLDDESEVGDHEARFVKIDSRAFGEEVAVIEIEMSVGNFGFTAGVFPEFVEVEASELAFNAEVWVPLDPASGQLREVFEMQMSYRVAGVIPEEKVAVAVDIAYDAGRTIVLHRIAD